MRRLGDPQQLNIYTYARNNPLMFIDPDGLDITVTGTEQDAYLKRLKKDVTFSVTQDKNGKVIVVDANGKELDKNALKALGKTLKGGEKELFNAITDSNFHVTIDTVRKDPNVDIGRFDGKGKNTIDAADLDLLDSPNNKGGLTSEQAVGHETVEAYYAAIHGSTDSVDAHNFANGFFGGLDDPIAKTIQKYGYYGPNGAMITSVSFEMPVHGMKGVREQITREFLTPIPANAIPKGHTPANITNVVKKP